MRHGCHINVIILIYFNTWYKAVQTERIGNEMFGGNQVKSGLQVHHVYNVVFWVKF